MKKNLLIIAFIHFVYFLSAATVSAEASSAAGITDGFITQWETTRDNQQIVIPVNTQYASDYNYQVVWGDGEVSTGQTGNATHTYASKGVHTVTITGDFPAIKFSSTASSDENDALITAVTQWGNGTWNGMDAAFRNCVNLVSVPNAPGPVLAPGSTLYCMFKDCASFDGDLDKWDVSNVRETANMFDGATIFNGNISTWNVSNVTNAQYMFSQAKVFNGDISGWNLAKAVYLNFMFEGAAAFNGAIGGWNVGKVERMGGMFKDATSFNQPVNDWDVSAVTSMGGMFQGATSFNQDLNSWDVASVTTMDQMFDGASSFNGEISAWNVSHLEHTTNMFAGDSVFNKDIGGWDVSSVLYMGGMFSNAVAFNQDIGNWDVGAVKDMNYMFYGASSFNQSLENWDVSSVQDMSNMFAYATSFNQNIIHWNPASVTNMSAMFMGATAFNQDIGGWDVSSVEDMGSMFYNAADFNQDLGGWQVAKVSNMYDMLSGSGLSVSNYEATLNGWAEQAVASGVELGADGLKYCDSSGRSLLVDGKNWQIGSDRRTCAVPAIPDGGGIVYVDSSVAVPGDGSSWDSALKYLSNATESARTNTDIKEIHVAKGTYYPVGDKEYVYQDSAFMITRSGLKVLGGYPGGGGIRNAALNETLLSGDIGQQDVLDDNSFGIVVIRDIAKTDSLIVDGFTVTKGAGLDSKPDIEEALLLAAGFTLIKAYGNTVVSHCKFIDNYSLVSSAMAITGVSEIDGVNELDTSNLANPQILNCLFKNNSVILSGVPGDNTFGSAFSSIAAAPYVSHCDFIDNQGDVTAVNASAFFGRPFFNRCTFSGNRAFWAPVSLSLLGGGPVFVNCLINDNVLLDGAGSIGEGEGGGAGEFLHKAIIGNYQYGTSRFINCTIVNNGGDNNAATGAALIFNMLASSSYITNSILWGNQSNSIVDQMPSTPSKMSYSLIEGVPADMTNHLLDGTTTAAIFADTANGHYDLLSGAPAVDQGINDSLVGLLAPYLSGTVDGGNDLAGNPRISNSVIDLGAFELPGGLLPVKMSRLTGRIGANNQATLSWTTYSEQQNKGFYVQESADGIQFKTLGFVESQALNGSGASTLGYHFEAGVVLGVRYFRLIQVDLGGRRNTSNVLTLDGKRPEFKLRAYPNPVHNKLHITIGGERGANARIILTSLNGTVIRRVAVSGDQTVIDMQGLASGVYVIRYTDDQNSQTLKVIRK